MSYTPEAMASRAATDGTPRARATGKGSGRPTRLAAPIPVHGDVLPQAEAIARLVRTGLSIKDAAKALGLSHDAAYRCLGDGRTVASLLLEGRLTREGLTEFQQAAWTFYDLVDKAEAEALALHTSAIARHAQGGNVRRVTTVNYDAQGNEIGRTEREEIIPPDLKASTFYVERRRPQEWGRAERHEIALVDGGAVVQTASPLDRLAQALEEIERRRSEGARVIEAHVVDDAESA